MCVFVCVCVCAEISKWSLAASRHTHTHTHTQTQSKQRYTQKQNRNRDKDRDRHRTEHTHIHRDREKEKERNRKSTAYELLTTNYLLLTQSDVSSQSPNCSMARTLTACFKTDGETLLAAVKESANKSKDDATAKRAAKLKRGCEVLVAASDAASPQPHAGSVSSAHLPHAIPCVMQAVHNSSPSALRRLRRPRWTSWSLHPKLDSESNQKAVASYAVVIA